MYPTSESYKQAIRQQDQRIRITGTLTLKDSTVIPITDADIALGSLYISEQCVTSGDLEVGNVYASELGFTLTAPIDNPYTLDGARVLFNFGLETADGWEYVPLGYFYITEIDRQARFVNLKALDGLILLDIDLDGVLTTGLPRAIIDSCCSKAGITLATDMPTFNTFANAQESLSMPEGSKVETCRDLIMWVCQVTGTFARMTRVGQLEIVPVAYSESVKTVPSKLRYKTDVSDFVVEITKVAMKTGEDEYHRGTEGMTLTLEENPLIAGKEPNEINAMLDEILAQVSSAKYAPYTLNFAGDPAVQAGDYITIEDAGLSEYETEIVFLQPTMPLKMQKRIVKSLVTHSEWRYGGSHSLKGVGKSALLRGVFSQQSKSVSGIQAIARIARELAQSANQSTQLIKDALGGNVLIRQGPDFETNEILIMDSADPDSAVKIWRWNMGGLGYSDNVVGADNPLRDYDVAMTMDGAINADFIRAGKVKAQYVEIGPETTYKVEEEYTLGRYAEMTLQEIIDTYGVSNVTIYKPSLLDKFKDFVNGVKANWDDYETHKAESANKAHGGIKGALLRKGATQLIPNDATTVLTWSDVVYNTDSIYDAGSPTRLTIPSGISKIKIVASVGFQENTNGGREVFIFKNGNGSYNGRASSTVVPVAGTGTVVQISSPILTVVAGDYFEIAVLQNSGDSLNVTDWYNIWFAIEAIE